MKPSRSSPATPKKVVEMAEADKPKLTPEKITQGSQSREDYQAEKLTRSVIEKRLYGEDNQTKGPENVAKDDEATNFAPKASERQSRSRREPRRKASNRSVRERSQRSRRARRNRMATTTAATTATTGMEMTAEEPPTRFPRRAKSNRKKIHNGQKDDGQTMGRTVPNVVIPEIYKKKLKKTSPTQEHSADKESPAVDYWNSPKEKPKYEWMDSKDAEKTDLRSVKEVEYGGGKFKQNELPPSQPKSPSRREKNFNNIEQMTREIYGVHDRPLKPPPPQRPATVQGELENWFELDIIIYDST
ncbi:unnamed protein product [Nippostrongylus brasiliensis]|uniref:Uncharacterized protein n=1 Tax=Nippostrongylus brasiliensis TaxID=27835 RepID=A0A0N4XH36_NIPBR|nr:hypothetical protein Q1695_009736 [Nippostrongylus brasiliensis]VDL65428.1 unnamed protein product [Nippostrongylus brasiliensis]